MQIILFILGFLLFISLVLVHEWGHYKVARRNGVKVEEFGLGLPPRAWGKKLKSGMLLSLNWLPLGGFVKLKGEYDTDTRPGSFGAANLWTKTKILLAGVTMNLLVGLALLTFLALVGMPKLLDKDTVGQDQFTVASDTKIVRQEVRVGNVQPGSPAESIGLISKDIIVSVAADGKVRSTKTPEQLHDATNEFAGKNVKITYKRGSEVVTKQTKLRSKVEVDASLKTDNPKGHLGISDPIEIQMRRSTWSAPVVAVGFTKQLVVLTFQGLGKALGGLGSTIAGLVTANKEARQNGQTQATEQVGGPVAIMAVLWGSGAYGISFMLWIIAVISLTLALMNILPIPALDGGRAFMILVSRGIFKKPLSKRAEERLVATGMALLLLLVALITVVDVKRFF